MGKGETLMKYAEYVQQIKHMQMSVEEMDHMLANNKNIERWAYCIHDKDIHEDGSKKEDHIHVMMQLKSDKLKPSDICEWFRDKAERIGYAKKKGKYAYNYMLSYLIHDVDTAKVDERFQYDPSMVVANFDYITEIQQIRQAVEESEAHINKLLVKISQGEIKPYEIDDYLNDIDQIANASKIDRAFAIQARRQTESRDRNMTVVYICGVSGVGKTTYAKELASRKYKPNEIYIAGTGNDPLQRYNSQPCIILDETRDSDWRMTDMLKLLDNNTASDIKARYSNKIMTNCELIIMTSTKSIYDLYQGLQENNDESIYQLKRRIEYTMYIDEQTVTINKFNPLTGNHEFQKKVPNPLKYILTEKEKTQKPKVNILQLVEDLDKETAKRLAE